jgi:indole-3-acetate monooxygenase
VAAEESGVSEQRRRLTDRVVGALRDADLLRLCVPSVYGGPEVDPVTFVRAIETIAEGDGAAGWCANIASTTATMSWYLEPDWSRLVFAGPEATGGAFAMNGSAVAVDGGWRCSGRWSWGSGTQHCAWITGGCKTADGELHQMIFDPSDVQFADNWHSMGLRGTGSTDFSVDGAFVPLGRSVRPGIDGPKVDVPLARMPNMALLASGLAAVSLGLALRAIHELEELAGAKRPMDSSKSLAEHVPAQLALSRATALHRSARAFLLESLADAYASLCAGDRLTMDQRSAIRLAASHTSEACTEAVDLCARAAGGTAVYETSVLQRCVRDVHTASAHMMTSDRNIITYARLRFGLPAQTTLW